MLDFDLARIYDYEVKALNQQVKRNAGRFPDDFMFQLTKEEVELVKSQIVTSSDSSFFAGQTGGRRKPPYAFIELRQLEYEKKTDEKLDKIFEYISDHEDSTQEVFFDGQIYDAFNLISSLIQNAAKSSKINHVALLLSLVLKTSDNFFRAYDTDHFSCPETIKSILIRFPTATATAAEILQQRIEG